MTQHAEITKLWCSPDGKCDPCFCWNLELVNPTGRLPFGKFESRAKLDAILDRIDAKSGYAMERRDIAGHFTLSRAPENLDRAANAEWADMAARIEKYFEDHDG